VLHGRGTPSTGPLWPKYWAYDSTIGAYAFNPVLAESLLDDAGYSERQASSASDRPPARLRFTCLIPANFSVWERVGLEVQRELFAIGVDMQFKVVPFEQFDALLREGEFDAALIDLISGPTPGRAYIFWRSGKQFGGLNVFGYENAEAERQFDVLRTSTNDADVRAATRQLQRVFLEDPPALFLAWNERARAIRRDYDIPSESGRDPTLSMWRWTPARALEARTSP
jgi:peptide/nickel transport system substrate-binding protein